MFASFIDFLMASLSDAGEPGARDVATVVNQLQSLTVSLQFGNSLRADTPLEDVLESILELPIKSDLFSLTVERLASMGSSDWQAFVGSVQASRDSVGRILENEQLWFQLHSNSKDEHAFIPLSDLP